MIRLTNKTNVRKRFGVDLWEQPIPKRWKADALRNAVFHGPSVGIVRSGIGLSHVGEPMGTSGCTVPRLQVACVGSFRNSCTRFWTSKCG